MKRILIYTSGTLGDHLPFIVLAQALRDRGHRVRLAVNAAMRRLVERAGLEAVVLDEPEMGPEEVRESAADWDHWAQAEDSIPYDAALSARLVRQLRELSRDADLLIATSIRPWGWLVERLTGVPLLSAAVTPAQFWWPSDPQHVATARDSWRRDLGDLKTILEDVAAVVDGPVDAVAEATFFLSDEVMLLSSHHFSAPRLEAFGPAPPEIRMTGFLFYEDPDWAGWRPDPQLARLFDAPERPIVLSFSSQPLETPGEVLAVHARAAAILGRPLVVQSGWAGFDEGDLPPEAARHDVTFVDFLPHDWLFSRAACAIQHGGVGSIARALRQGCPLLIEPYGNDQFVNALRVLALGVGAAMKPGSLTPDRLARVLRGTVLTAESRRRASELAARLRAEDGPDLACQLIEDKLEFR